MKAIASLLLMFTLCSGKSAAFASTRLQNGDLILQSNRCYLCTVIEDEESSSYSHMGVLVQDHGAWKVLEAWDHVQETSLETFLSRRRAHTPALILRMRDPFDRFGLNSQSLHEHFRSFVGKHYDSDFSWSNRDELGEKYYCSEFVAKFLSPFLSKEIPTKPMHFDLHRDFWMNYFHGNPPDGQPGLSPGDFERSPLFKKVGFL